MKKGNIVLEQTGEEVTTEEMVLKESIRRGKGKRTSFRIKE